MPAREIYQQVPAYPALGMKSHPVSQQVNRAQAIGPYLVEPVVLNTEATNLTLF